MIYMLGHDLGDKASNPPFCQFIREYMSYIFQADM